MSALRAHLTARWIRLVCRLRGHAWTHWRGGHVYAGDDWGGDWHDGHPWASGFSSCRRCGARK